MLLTNEQWDVLESIYIRVAPLLDNSGREAFLIPIARSVGKSVQDSPFARWLTIPGANDFIVIMRSVIQSQNEPLLEKSLILVLLQRSLNTEDQEVLKSWLEQAESNSSSSPAPSPKYERVEMRLESQDAKEILEESINVFKAYDTQQKQLLIATISNTLRTAKDLASNLIKSGCLNLQPDANEEALAESLLSHEFPIKLLDDIVSAWLRNPKGYYFVAQDG